MNNQAVEQQEESKQIINSEEELSKNFIACVN